MTSKLDAALALAARGFKVFPIKANAKAPPLVKDWPALATTEAKHLRTWWAGWPNANIGIHCEGLLVIDVDPKKGGNETYAELETELGLAPTLTTITPSGGRHVFYRLPDGVAGVGNSVEARLGRGVDTRSEGGYVVAPGSEVGGKRYRFAADTPVAVCSAALLGYLGGHSRAASAAERAVPPADAPATVVERAAEWLRNQPGAVEGAGGDAHTFQVACGLRDLGVSKRQANELLADWNLTCSPPWVTTDLETKVRNAYAYAQNEPGSAVAKPEDFPLLTPQPEAPRPVRAHLASLAALAASETTGPGYLVKGLLQRRTYAEVFGAPGEGKTFVALDIGYAVAAAIEWMGRRVHAGCVLYLAYEGQGGLVRRAQALRKKYGDKDVPLYVASATFNLRVPEGRKELGALIGQLPEKPVLIVIDTFARALMGGDENSAQDVGAFNSAVAALIENTGACVLIIHHSGKNKSAGARGSSALLGAIDTEIEVDSGTVTANKQRDMETGEPIGFKLKPVLIGMDEDGDEVTSCVVEPDAVAPSGPQGKLSGNAKRAWEVLCDLSPQNQPVLEEDWKKGCARFIDRDLSKRFWDMKRTLVKRGYVQVDEAGRATRRCE